MRVVIADDHAIVREGIRMMLNREDAIEVIGEAADGSELLTMLEDADPDIVLLDIRMDGVGGLEVLERIGDEPEGPAIIVLTMHDDPTYLHRAVELGARGYLLKQAGRSELLRALRVVTEGGAYIDPQLAGDLVGLAAGEQTGWRPDGDDGTILAMLGAGAGNREVAESLGWTDSQLKTRLRAIYEQLGAESRLEAVATALRRGLID